MNVIVYLYSKKNDAMKKAFKLSDNIDLEEAVLNGVVIGYLVAGDYILKPDGKRYRVYYGAKNTSFSEAIEKDVSIRSLKKRYKNVFFGHNSYFNKI